jgi:hypothetical protein
MNFWAAIRWSTRETSIYCRYVQTPLHLEPRLLLATDSEVEAHAKGVLAAITGQERRLETDGTLQQAPICCCVRARTYVAAIEHLPSEILGQSQQIKL